MLHIAKDSKNKKVVIRHDETFIFLDQNQFEMIVESYLKGNVHEITRDSFWNTLEVVSEQKNEKLKNIEDAFKGLRDKTQKFWIKMFNEFKNDWIDLEKENEKIVKFLYECKITGGLNEIIKSMESRGFLMIEKKENDYRNKKIKLCFK